MTDLFTLAVPLRKKFGVEHFTCALESVHTIGESVIHELCHVVALEHRELRLPLGRDLSYRLGCKIEELTNKVAADNECEALAIELVLLEMYGHLDIRNDPELLGIFLRDLWDGQPASMQNRFRRSFRKFVLHILELRDTDWIREAAVSVRRRVHYWRRK